MKTIQIKPVRLCMLAVLFPGLLNVIGYCAEQSHELHISRSKEDLRGFMEQVQNEGEPAAMSPLNYVAPFISKASREEEAEWMNFVRQHPGLDYATYRIAAEDTHRQEYQGQTLLVVAVACNYTNLIGLLESRHRVVSRLKPPATEGANLLLRAMAWQSFGAMEQIARLRPDFLVPGEGERPLTYHALALGNMDLMERLLEWGVDVDCPIPWRGATLMDLVKNDPHGFELVRRHGGRRTLPPVGFFECESFVPKPYRLRMVQRNMDKAACLYSNRIEFTNGVIIPLPDYEILTLEEQFLIRARWKEMAQADQDRLEMELKELGRQSERLVLFRCQNGGVYHLQPHIEPILNRLNLVGLYLQKTGTDSPYIRPYDFCPFVEEAEKSSSHTGAESHSAREKYSPEEMALAVEWRYQQGMLSFEDYREKIERLGFVPGPEGIP